MVRLTFFLSILSLALGNCGFAHNHPGKDQPMVYALDATALSINKARINAKEKVALQAYERLIKDAKEALTFGPVSVMEKKNIPPSGNKHDYMSLAPYFWPDPAKPDGLPYIRKDGQTNPEVKEYKDKEYLPRLCSDAQTLGLAFYFSGEKQYAEHAAKLIRVWFLDTATRMNPNLNYGQAIKGVNAGRGAGLIDIRHFIKLVDAIGLIKDSKSWTPTDEAGMKKWFGDFLNWMQTSKNGIAEMNAENNHGAWYEAVRLSLALYTGDQALARKSVETAQQRLDQQMDAQFNFPKELARTTSLHYTTFAMEAFLNIAAMSRHTGIDLWNFTSPSGKSLRVAFYALHPYLVKEKEWTGEQIKPFDFEEGYFLLMEAGRHFDCKRCANEVRMLAGDKADRLRLNLLY